MIELEKFDKLYEGKAKILYETSDPNYLIQYFKDDITAGNGDKKDASHKGGKIVGFEAQSKNRGRAEASRLKKK